MRLVNLDEFAAGKQNGRTAVMKVLDRWEKEHPVNLLELKMSDYDITLHCKTDTVEIRRKTK